MTGTRLVLLTAFALSCGGGSEDDATDATYIPATPPDLDTSLGDDTGGTTDDTKEIMEFSVGGWFGYDAALGTTAPVLDEGDPIASYFYIELRSTDYNGSCDDEVCCYVYIEIDGYTGESFATDAGLPFGFHVPQGTAAGFSTCLDNGFDPADPAFAGMDPFLAWSDPALGWGVAIGGFPSTTVTEWTGQDDPYSQIIGGQFVSTSLGAEDTIYFLGLVADSTMEVQDDLPHDRATYVDDYGALTNGYYEFDVMVHFDPIPQ